MDIKKLSSPNETAEKYNLSFVLRIEMVLNSSDESVWNLGRSDSKFNEDDIFP